MRDMETIRTNDGGGSVTEVIQNSPTHINGAVRLQLNYDTQDASANSRRVAFDEAWVDNENLDKRKSKCCCIFTKQRLFDESSSEDDDDCPDHCGGKKRWHKKKQKPKDGDKVSEDKKDDKPSSN